LNALAPRKPDAPLALGLAGSVVLAALACRELLRFQPRTNMVVPLSSEVEEWFFEPSDSSPVVVLALCAWLLWRRRARLAPLWGAAGPAIWTALPWALATGIFVWSVRADAPDLQALALIGALLGAANLLGGLAAMRVAAPPAAILLFAPPLPAPLLNQIVWTLQIWTAEFTGWLLHLLGMAALVSGDRIIMSDGLFAIIETCSGTRAIETLALLAILMVDLFGRRGVHALVLLLASLPVAFLINGLRCVGLILNPHSDVASIHNLQGIAMLLGGVLGLYFIDGGLARVLPPAEPVSRIERRAREKRPARRPLAGRVALVAGLSLGWVALSWLPPFEVPRPRAAPSPKLLEQTVGSPGEALPPNWLFLGKALFGPTWSRRFVADDGTVDVFLAAGNPRHRLRSYLSPKTALPGSGWIVEAERAGELAGREVRLLEVRRGARRELVAHWFESSPGLAVESLRALFALDSSPWPRTRRPAAVRLATTLADEPSARERAEARLERFAERLSPAIDEICAPRGI
jgi:EpsI family protein